MKKMKKMKKIIYLLSGLTLGALPPARFPQSEIDNGIIHAKIFLPDARKGYYRGTRFDWSGNMPVLEFKGHSFFDQWFPKYSPEIHDAVMGPVEVFNPVNYTGTKPGGSFLKIGVGMLSKPDENPYSFSRLYKIINPGKWTISRQSDNVMFIHDLNDKDYSYHYEKTILLTKNKPELILKHVLKNNGSTTIETSVYDHNFFVIDKQPVGPGIIIRLPRNITGKGKGIGDLADFEGNKIVFLKRLLRDDTVYCGEVDGLSTSVEDYDIRIENTISGAGVRITCDKPLEKLVFWSCSTTACPEPYIKVKAEPGQEFSWEIRYEFYTLPQ
jgi:hypothetical protein